jgi:hypothetical protein
VKILQLRDAEGNKRTDGRLESHFSFAQSLLNSQLLVCFIWRRMESWNCADRHLATSMLKTHFSWYHNFSSMNRGYFLDSTCHMHFVIKRSFFVTMINSMTILLAVVA